MRAFELAVVACFAVVLCVGDASAQRGSAGSWTLLHAAEISNATATMTIPLPAAVRSKAIRLHLKSGTLVLTRVRASYGTGQVHFEDRTISLAAGDRTKPIDGREEERIVASITLFIDQAKSAVNSKLEIWVLAVDVPPPRATSQEVTATPTSPQRTEATTGRALASGDVLFGAQNVGFGVDRDAIRIGQEIAKFDRIRLRALDNDIHINEVKVIYSNGEPDVLAVNADLKQNTKTNWLDLKGDRFIKEIQLKYRSKPSFKGQARVEVFGEYAAGWLGPNGEGKKYNQGWVLLGAQPAGFVGFDSDTIPVGQNEGGFKKIRITVRDRAITLNEVNVVYANGNDDVIPVKTKVEAGTTYGPVDLKGGTRAIKEIKVKYRSRFFDKSAKSNGATILEIWGQNGGAPGSPSISAPNVAPEPVGPKAAAPPLVVSTEPSKSDEPYARVPILFGTNRQKEEDIRKNNRNVAVFSGLAGNGLTLGRAVVTVPTPKDPEKRRDRGTIQRPLEIKIVGVRVAMRSEDPTRDFTIESVDVQDPATFSAILTQEVSKAREFAGQALIFVHGYNVSFDDALFRAAQISHDVGFDGATLVYSWPSKAGLFDYAYDQRQVRDAREPLREFIELVSREQGITKLNFIAHSMGNDPLLEVLSGIAASGGRDPGSLRINEVILAAPDVPVTTFRTLAKRIVPLVGGGLTLYASSTDMALIASRQVDSTPKAGFVGGMSPAVVEGVQTIDVSKASTAFLSLNHSSFAERRHVLMDIGMLLKTGKRPPDVRAPSIWESMERGRYWRYVPN